MAYNESKAAEINAHRVATTVTPVADAPDIVVNRFVKIGGAANEIVYAAAATDAIIGVTDGSGDIGDLVAVQYTGIHTVVCGAAVTIGSFVTSDAAGKAIIGTQANHIGKALDVTTAADQLLTVSLE